ncbi:hypothetical protein ETB97_002397 [Aspergillus alliaceus]|uniref:Uncharacterized protein n=1 Tax=Petromyces alliaceus TaxID=209559 RepID=A0A8H6E6C2_PETAA|nr:hypothetical protein ETB97_002397 [Aspergillus burnettii]
MSDRSNTAAKEQVASNTSVPDITVSLKSLWLDSTPRDTDTASVAQTQAQQLQNGQAPRHQVM